MANPNQSNPLLGLKDVDTERLTQAISEHQNTVIKLFFIIVSFVAVIFMFSDCQHKKWLLNQKIAEEKTKLGVINDRVVSLQDLNRFKSSLPKKISEFELISLISEHAKSFNTTVSTLTPGEAQDKSMYDIININFDAESDNFKDAMLFMRSLEKSDYPIKFDSWSGREQEGGRITFSVSLSLVLIH